MGCMQMLYRFIIREGISHGFWSVGMVGSGFPIRGIYVYYVHPLGFLEMAVFVYVHSNHSTLRKSTASTQMHAARARLGTWLHPPA